MLDEIERAARAAHARGQTAAEAGAAYALPASLGEWVLFNKVFYERAFTAWYRSSAPTASAAHARSALAPHRLHPVHPVHPVERFPTGCTG